MKPTFGSRTMSQLLHNSKHKTLLISIVLALSIIFFAVPVSAASTGCNTLNGPPFNTAAPNWQYYVPNGSFQAGEVITWDMVSGAADGYNAQVLVEINLNNVLNRLVNTWADVVHETGSYVLPTTGTYTINIYSHDGPGWSATGIATVSGTVTCGLPPPTITSAVPPAGTVGVPYSHTFVATGSPAPTFSVSGTLPNGIAFDGVDTISGTPTVPATFNGLSVTASNGNTPDPTQNFSITINGTGPTITSGAPANGTINVAYSHTFTASGNPAPTFSVTAGALQPDLTLDGVSGLLSGTPTTTGTFNFTVTATNGVAPDATQNVTLVIGTVPVIPPPVVAPAVVELPAPPPATACSDVNFEDPGVIRSHFTNDADRAGLRCGLIAAGGDYRTWNGGPITFSSNIGSQTVLDLGVIAAVDVFSTAGQSGFVGDVNICLQGSGYIIYLNANSSPRVPQLWSNWTTDAFPGYTCTTLYAPGTVVLVQRHP